MSNQFNARVQHKIDTWENWGKAENFTPLKGEIIIYTTNEKGENEVKLKIGDGKTNVNLLPFITSAAAPNGGENNPIDLSNVIRYDIEQNLTEEQQNLVKKNINASSIQIITWEEND